MRAAVAGEPLVVRNPRAVRPWQHVLNPLSGYLLLAERLWEAPAEHATAWNFGADDDDARPVSWIVERLSDRWPGDVGVQTADRTNADEAMARKLDSSRARTRLDWRPGWALAERLDATVEWYSLVFGAGAVVGVPLIPADPRSRR